MIKAIFFDVDGTLTEPGYTAWHGITTGLGASIKEHHKIFSDLWDDGRGVGQVNKNLLRIWMATGKATKINITRILKKEIKLRRGVKECFKDINRKNIKIILLTNTPDINLEVTIDVLGKMDGTTHTKFIFNKNGSLKNIHYAQDGGQIKLKYFKKYIKELNLKPDECGMIGNGPSDLPVMKLTGFTAAPKVGSDQRVLDYVEYVFDDFTDLSSKINAIQGF